LREHEETPFELAAGIDYWPWLEFSRLTGLRLSETLLQWDEVNFFTGKLTTLGKGGKTVTAEISTAVKELLLSQKGNHPEYVFTYVAKRTVKATEKREERIRGAAVSVDHSGMLHRMATDDEAGRDYQPQVPRPSPRLRNEDAPRDGEPENGIHRAQSLGRVCYCPICACD
jgi:hypothetical protein